MTTREEQRHSPAPGLIGLVGCCFDEHSSFLRGPAEAPPLIRAAFHSDASNQWSESGVDLGQPGTFVDAGDIAPVAGRAMPELIDHAVTALLAKGLLPLVLGGDHAITYPVVKALARVHRNLSILHFDAHPDLYHDFRGDPHSHASPFARIMEEQLVTRLVQVGIRTMNGHQREQAERFGVEVIEMRQWSLASTLRFTTPVYISFDMDGLDPAFAPGVSHREPGGPSTRQALEVIQRVDQPVVGADIVELNPRMDTNGVTATVCAKLLREIAAKMVTGARAAAGGQ